MAADFATEIKGLRATMASVRGVTDLDALQARIGDLEGRAAAPNLWDDPERRRRSPPSCPAPRRSTTG